MNKKTVAIVGGGISGLVCAGRLNQLGLKNVTVFDGGRHSLGGRCSSRDVKIKENRYRFDHGAQYITIGDALFAPWVGILGKRKFAKMWKGNIGKINQLREFKAYPPDYQVFVGVEGMSSIAEGLASLATNVHQNTWVNSVAWDSDAEKWIINSTTNTPLFSDYLVLANNGYQAQRLIQNIEVNDGIKRLFQFKIKANCKRLDSELNMAAIWSLIVAFPRSLQLPFDGAHVDDEDVAWIANNTRKFDNPFNSGSNSDDPLECWTILSTKSFGFDHSAYKYSGYLSRKDPNYDEEEMKKIVTHKLLNGFARITRRMPSRLNPCFTKAQIWETAIPLNVLRNGDACVYSKQSQLGICADWCKYPSIEGAAVSGITIADRITQAIKGQIRSSSYAPKFHSSNTSSQYSGVPVFFDKRQEQASLKQKKNDIIPIDRILPPKPVKPWHAVLSSREKSDLERLLKDEMNRASMKK